ncbi:MAG: T9SS type A sorting domain-containing protein [Candidatus Kapaibacterium sp.]
MNEQTIIMLIKRLFTLTLLAELAFMPARAVLAQWFQDNGPASGYISCFATIGTNLFCGTNSSNGASGNLENGGIFLSTNYGTTWTAVKNNITGGDVASLAVMGSKLYAAINTDPSLPNNVQGSIFCSTDNGFSWTKLPHPDQGSNEQISALAVIDSFLFVASEPYYLHYTTDNGLHWTSVAAKGLPFTGIGNEALWVIGKDILLRRSGGIYRTSDNGSSWTTFNTSFTSNTINAIVSSGINIFAGTDRDGVFLSTDNGTSWTAVNSGLLNTYVKTLSIIGTTLFAGTEIGGFFTTSNGTQWNLSNAGLPATGITASAVIGAQLFAGVDIGRVYLSLDSGQTWPKINTGLNHLNVQSLAISGEYLFAGIQTRGLSATYRSSDNGVTWTDISDTVGGRFAVIGNSILSSSTGIVNGALGPIYRSTNNGDTWARVPTDAISGIEMGDRVNSFVFCYPNIIVAAPTGIFTSTDNGATWPGTEIEGSVSSLIVRDSDVFGGEPSGFFYRSTNSGISWSIASEINVYSLAAINGNIFAGTDSGVSLSTNDGVSWREVDAGLLSDTVNAFTHVGNDLFAGFSGGSIFLTTNNGSSWTLVSSGLICTDIQDLALTSQDIIAATDNGVWRRPLSDFGISSVAQTPVAARPAIQFFPNPFTQSTEITFATQAAGYAEVSIVNTLGAEVARLFTGPLGSGNHSFTWEAGRMPAPQGMYWCVVKRDGRVETVPIALVR